MLRQGNIQWSAPPAIGDQVPNSGAFTTLAASGQITSTLATGTAPLVVASTTLVANLYVARAALADAATTNANLTGPITSVGNATSIASQTGTGTTFAMSASPTFTGTVGAAAITASGLTTGSAGAKISGALSGNTVAALDSVGTIQGAATLQIRPTSDVPQLHLAQSNGATEGWLLWAISAGGQLGLQRYTSSVATTRLVISTSGSVTAESGTAIPAGGTAGTGLMVSSTANFGVFFGSGAPTLSAAKGSLYLRSDGSTTNDRAYINTNGSTTWTALTTAA